MISSFIFCNCLTRSVSQGNERLSGEPSHFFISVKRIELCWMHSLIWGWNDYCVICMHGTIPTVALSPGSQWSRIHASRFPDAYQPTLGIAGSKSWLGGTPQG